MFALIFWLSTAAFTVLWAVTGGEWWGFGVSGLLALRVAMLTFCVVSLFSPEILMQQRMLHRKSPPAVRFGDYLLDFGMLAVLGWITQQGARLGLPALGLALASMLLWEILTSVLEDRR